MQWTEDMAVGVAVGNNMHGELINRLNGLWAAIRKQACSYKNVVSVLCGCEKNIMGIVTICSICHKIHSKKGLWREKENFQSIPLETVYSHGICPECLQMYYADLFQEKRW